MPTDRPTAEDRRSTERPTEEREADAAREIELGGPFGSHVADAFGFEAEPTTFRELWERMLATFTATLERPLGAADLCTTDRSPHRAVADGESQSFRCVIDAFVFAGVYDGDITVRTVSPLHGHELVVKFDRTGAATTPDGAVLSVGVERGVSAPDGPVTPERMYGRLCPYNRAFVSREEYERWTDARPDVATEAVPLGAGLTSLARVVGRAFDPDEQAHRDGSGDAAGCACTAERDR